MNLSAPTKIVFIISLILAIVAILMFVGVLGMIPVPSFWVMTGAYVVLLAGCLLKGV